MDQLKLAAFDAEDLAVVSAHVQDAVLKVGDIAFIPKEKRFAGVINRFVWEKQPEAGAHKKSWERRRSGFHFDRVLAVRSVGIDRSRPDAVLDLLAIAFEPREEPAGTITLIFAGGGAIALDVECIEAAVRDLGPAWSTQCCPEHSLDEQFA
ncbi:DUF2948 family protein [Kaistia nematophila]|uniref:DUF2948 family protein n=1 Tax=Kaistia nematophila TaxID=2994654 RepID=A0A9X3IP93_9HYPH|nr:DUF2948 family protein [Kaistia nematophila]MCX5571730.1 DUF2948 family protein [Kaistia nematophila]